MPGATLLTLSRIHRLLRVLRTSLRSLALADRQARQQLKGPRTGDEARKGKRASASGDEEDEDEEREEQAYRPSQAGSRMVWAAPRRRTKGKSVAGPSSRPYGRPKEQQDDQKKAERSTRNKEALVSSDKELVQRFVAAGMPATTAIKAANVFKAYRGVLEAVYGAFDQQAQASQKVKGKARAVPSLLELTGRRIGALIEDEVRAFMDRRSPEDEEDVMIDESWMFAADQLYESCRPVAWPWLLAEHATTIVLEGLPEPVIPLLESITSACYMYDARSEAARFYPACIRQYLHASPPLRSTCCAPAMRAAQAGCLQRFCRDLVDALCQSTFDDRLFYSPWLDVPETHASQSLKLSSECACRLLASVIAVGTSMMGIIGHYDEDEGSVVEAKGTHSRIESLVALYAPYLFADEQHVDLGAVLKLSDSTFAFVSAHHGKGRSFACDFSITLELWALVCLLRAAPSSSASSIPTGSAIHLSRLAWIGGRHPLRSSSRSMLFRLLKSLEIKEMEDLALVLHEGALFDLEIRLLKEATQEHVPPGEAGLMATFLDLIEAAEQARLLENGTVKKHRYESMIGAFVATTPTPEPEPDTAFITDSDEEDGDDGGSATEKELGEAMDGSDSPGADSDGSDEVELATADEPSVVRSKGRLGLLLGTPLGPQATPTGSRRPLRRRDQPLQSRSSALQAIELASSEAEDSSADESESWQRQYESPSKTKSRRKRRRIAQSTTEEDDEDEFSAPQSDAELSFGSTEVTALEDRTNVEEDPVSSSEGEVFGVSSPRKRRRVVSSAELEASTDVVSDSNPSERSPTPCSSSETSPEPQPHATSQQHDKTPRRGALPSPPSDVLALVPGGWSAPRPKRRRSRRQQVSDTSEDELAAM